MKNVKVYLIILFSIAFASLAFAAADVKEADLAGNWYPKDKMELTYLLTGYLKDANPEKIGGRAFAIISPHAGYRFSGPVASYGFKAVRDQNIRTVIVIGFAHRKYFETISVYDRGSFKTPLGEIKIDEELAKAIIAQDRRISFYPEAFKGENSVEMQVPFIQLTFKDVKIVPIAFGTQVFDDAKLLANALANTLKDRDDYLIVASTDMSHYHSYEEAKSIDKHTISLIKAMAAKELYEEARLGICELCGMMPVSATILAAQKLGFDKIKILRYANSGDTFGSKDNVVGYVSAAIYKEGRRPKTTNDEPRTTNGERGDKKMLNDAQRKRLLQIARESITTFVMEGKRREFKENDVLLNKPLGAFVTLRENGELRGCIGNMVGQGPLYQTVGDMAIEAATGDPRFMSLSPKEIDKIDIEISVLSPLRRVSSYEDVKIPGHGVMVKRGFKSGVYLPQVATEAGWNKEEFLTSLCGHKAGMAPNAWKDPQTQIYVFEAEVFGEKGKE